MAGLLKVAGDANDKGSRVTCKRPFSIPFPSTKGKSEGKEEAEDEYNTVVTVSWVVHGASYWTPRQYRSESTAVDGV